MQLRVVTCELGIIIAWITNVTNYFSMFKKLIVKAACIQCTSDIAAV